MPPLPNGVTLDGQMLRELRERLNLTLRDVADRAGISYGYLARLERGEKSNASRGVADSLAQALSVPVAALQPPKAA